MAETALSWSSIAKKMGCFTKQHWRNKTGKSGRLHTVSHYQLRGASEVKWAVSLAHPALGPLTLSGAADFRTWRPPSRTLDTVHRSLSPGLIWPAVLRKVSLRRCVMAAGRLM